MPSSPSYKRNYRNEAKTESSARKQARRDRVNARYAMEKEHGKSALKGKDVGHKKALSKGGSNSRSNLFVQASSSNQSFSRNKDGSMKSETSRRERKGKKK